MSEQRREPRHAIALRCQLSLGGRVVTGRTKDLSRGGIALFLSEPLALSAVVDLAISLVFADDSFSEPLAVKAMIVWCTRLGAAYQIGAKFAKVTREQRSYLDMFLQYLEADDQDETPKPGAGRRQ